MHSAQRKILQVKNIALDFRMATGGCLPAEGLQAGPLAIGDGRPTATDPEGLLPKPGKEEI